MENNNIGLRLTPGQHIDAIGLSLTAIGTGISTLAGKCGFTVGSIGSYILPVAGGTGVAGTAGSQPMTTPIALGAGDFLTSFPSAGTTAAANTALLTACTCTIGELYSQATNLVAIQTALTPPAVNAAVAAGRNACNAIKDMRIAAATQKAELGDGGMTAASTGGFCKTISTDTNSAVGGLVGTAIFNVVNSVNSGAAGINLAGYSAACSAIGTNRGDLTLCRSTLEAALYNSITTSSSGTSITTTSTNLEAACLDLLGAALPTIL